MAAQALAALAQKLLAVCKNPQQPGFNHYLFESVAGLIRWGCAANAAMVLQFEESLFPAFQVVLSVRPCPSGLQNLKMPGSKGLGLHPTDK